MIAWRLLLYFDIASLRKRTVSTSLNSSPKPTYKCNVVDSRLMDRRFSINQNLHTLGMCSLRNLQQSISENIQVLQSDIVFLRSSRSTRKIAQSANRCSSSSSAPQRKIILVGQTIQSLKIHCHPFSQLQIFLYQHGIRFFRQDLCLSSKGQDNAIEAHASQRLGVELNIRLLRANAEGVIKGLFNRPS